MACPNVCSIVGDWAYPNMYWAKRYTLEMLPLHYRANAHRQTNPALHTPMQFRVSKSLNMQVFLLWEETHSVTKRTSSKQTFKESPKSGHRTLVTVQMRTKCARGMPGQNSCDCSPWVTGLVCVGRGLHCF